MSTPHEELDSYLRTGANPQEGRDPAAPVKEAAAERAGYKSGPDWPEQPKLSDPSGLKSLGSGSTAYSYQGADKALLERFPNPLLRIGAPIQYSGIVDIEAPEFTSLCPLTGQPDFATIIIKYRPIEWCVESKSLKLYLGSFRQTGEFHEACVQRIAQDLWSLLQPAALLVRGEFTPRGGIKFWPEVKMGDYISLW